MKSPAYQLLYTRTMERQCRKSGAFTMVELLIVVMIIAILSAIGLPRYLNFYSSQSLVAMQNAILAVMRAALPLSKALRAPVWVAIDLDNDKVWITLNGVAVYGTKAPTMTSNAQIAGIAKGSAAEVTTGTVYYRFDYWGVVTGDTSAPSTYTIHIGSKSNTYSTASNPVDYRTITMINDSGRVGPYSVGCFGSSTAWGSPQWAVCSSL